MCIEPPPLTRPPSFHSPAASTSNLISGQRGIRGESALKRRRTWECLWRVRNMKYVGSIRMRTDFHECLMWEKFEVIYDNSFESVE